MSDDNQIEIPPSFTALFLRPGSSKPSASREEIHARYEFCEDLSNMLVETTHTMMFSLGITQADVFERIGPGLADGDAGVQPHEVQWILRRLGELLG